MKPASWLLLGGLVVSVLDGLDAVIFFGIRGVTPVQIMQTIASGLLGSAAYQGGMATATLGLLLHFGISLAIVVFYYLASRRLPELTRRPLVLGPLYGLMVYAVMNFVVLPLSAANTGSRTTSAVVNGLLIHVFGVGLISALFSRAASRADWQGVTALRPDPGR